MFMINNLSTVVALKMTRIFIEKYMIISWAHSDELNPRVGFQAYYICTLKTW